MNYKEKAKKKLLKKLTGVLNSSCESVLRLRTLNDSLCSMARNNFMLGNNSIKFFDNNLRHFNKGDSAEKSQRRKRH